jgi:CBS domain containing-hemolysin-like protein
MTTVQLLIGALTLLTNAFFVGAEFSLVSVRRSQIEPRARRGEKRARTVLWGLEHLTAMLATAQLGITVSSLVLGAVAEPAIAHLLEPPFAAIHVPHALVHPIAFVIALTAATYLHMLIGEMVPKNIALAAPVQTSLLLVPALVTLTQALQPLVFGINAFANVLLRLLKVEPRDHVAVVFTDDQIARLVEDSTKAGLIEPSGSEWLRDALELGSRPVGEILVPMEEMVTVDHLVTPDQLERKAVTTGYSRLPVIGPAGTVLGYLHIKDTIGIAGRDAPFPRRALHPITSVKVDTPLDDALTAMRAAETHMAVVVGDTGAVLGFITMEDVLDELLGPEPTPEAA